MHDADIPTLRRILRENLTIAVVGLSANWYRPSYFAAKYMQEHGYRIIPVNPQYEEVLGEKCYKSLREIPDKVDIVDCFQKTERILPLAEEAIAICCQGALAADRGGQRSRRHPGRGRGPRRGDGPLRKNRARPPLRRAQLGRCEHAGHLCQAAAVTSRINPRK